ncbi:MAG: hypothetical protein KKC75_03595 [Nanoarchaeota archaeon]|nr:hypothetical protein [Nanoarchaeota archaeon]MBU1005118.1 hypothetical protein [Nanoarchaeota archaeon]MBU1946821.1 hypothetical protein [Nanoarchaeota archaeon]
MRKYDKRFLKSIKELSNYCKSCESKRKKIEPYDIWSESDLKCFLYRELIDINSMFRDTFKVEVINRTKKQYPKEYEISSVHSEFQYSIYQTSSKKSKGKNKPKIVKKSADLIILDKDEVKYEIDSESFGFFLDEKIRKSLIVELKFSLKDSKNKIISKIMMDYEKLSKEKGILNKYVVLFDVNKKMEKDFFYKELKKCRGVRIVYIDRGGRILTKPLGLLNGVK